MSHSVPPSLIREQLPAITGMTSGLLWSLTPPAIKSRLIDASAERRATVASGSDRLVEHYVRWTGAPASRYEQTLPAHFFSKYGMSMVAALTGQVPYNLMSVVNQGCHFRIHSLIPRHTPILLRGQLLDCSRDGKRVRIHTRVTVGTTEVPEAMTVDTLAAVMLGKSDKKAPRDKPLEPAFETVGHWSADEKDGQRFFYLTGDFNPIHTFWPLARRTRFGGCILHGFGTLSRTWETIQNAGFEIRDFDARFVKPNLLPTGELSVGLSVEQADGRRSIRLSNAQGDVFLAGTVIAMPSALD